MLTENGVKHYYLENLDEEYIEFFVLFLQLFYKSEIISKLQVKRILSTYIYKQRKYGKILNCWI